MVIHVIQACILVIADLPPLVNEFHFLNILLSVWRFILSLPGTGLIQRPGEADSSSLYAQYFLILSNRKAGL